MYIVALEFVARQLDIQMENDAFSLNDFDFLIKLILYCMNGQVYQVYFIPSCPMQIPVSKWHRSPSQHPSPVPQPVAPSLKHMPPLSSGHLKPEHLLTSPTDLRPFLHLKSTSSHLLTFTPEFSLLTMLSTSPSP